MIAPPEENEGGHEEPLSPPHNRDESHSLSQQDFQSINIGPLGHDSKDDHSSSPRSWDEAGHESDLHSLTGGFNVHPFPNQRRGVRFADRQYQNLTVGLFFVAFTCTIFWIELFDFGDHPLTHKENYMIVMSALISVGLGVVCLCTWVCFAKLLLWFSEYTTILFLGLLSFIYFVLDGGSSRVGFISAAVALWLIIWLHRNRNSRDFDGVLIQMVASLIVDNPMVYLITPVFLFVQTLWLAIWAVTTTQALQSAATSSFATFALIYLFFAFFWTTQVLKHVIHACVSETIARWYFNMPIEEGGLILPLKRALTSAFGAICYGSLLVAPIRAAWLILRPLSQLGIPIVDCLFERVAQICESLYLSANQFGFAPVMMYGKDFKTASRDNWENFDARGVDAIIWQLNINMHLAFPQIGGGCLIASVCAVWAKLHSLENWLIMSCVVFAVGFATIALTTEVIEGAISTVLVCFSEEPQHLAETHPIIFHRFVRISEFSSFRNRRVEL